MRKRKRVFRHKMIVKDFVEVGKNELNQPIREWVPYMEIRAEVDPLRGRERWASRQVYAEQITRISFRYSKKASGIKPSMIVEWGERERTFEIIEPPINPYESNYEIQLMCKEKVS